MKIKEITIQATGGAGDGSLATGALMARAFVRLGYFILIHDTFPAEIRGFGKSVSEVRISTRDVAAKADSSDVLIGLNNVFAIEQIKDLSERGIVIYDSQPGITVKDAESIPNHAGNLMNCYGLPLEFTAQKATGKKLGKNVVAVGFLSKLLNFPPDEMKEILKELFARKGEEVLNNNIALFMSGYEYEDIEYAKIELEMPPNAGKKFTITSGNDAMSQGAINAGLAFFAGYPITPASKIMENLAVKLPKYGGAVLQTEDEIAAIGAVLGAWFTGRRAMTATSGPGLSLMTEIINLGVMTEIPLVIINAMRGGPSTGLPTKVEQADLNLALYGGHGDSPRVVLAPATIGECYGIIQDGLDVAEKYQTPVIVLSDKFLGMSYVAVPENTLEEKRVSTRLAYAGSPDDYMRYLVTPDGVSPWVIPGEEEISYTATGLGHDEMGAPNYDIAVNRELTEKRFRKFDTMLSDLPPPEFFGEEDAPNLIVTWGSTFGAVLEAVERLREQGYALRVAKVQTIFPQHEEIMREALSRAKKIIIPEQNQLGQFAKFIKGVYGVSADEVHLPSGAPVRPGDAEKLIKERLDT
ncbi:MAG: 2-oxoacid:acceptor oxidoreductase subunit alpha [Deltaproteobacteria bacterium]|nr:2-oxoacid:acceptor oxidoreductase subunit alpha [Deltaproteobacteria bacterium]